jgi:LacI family transcriptional regulator
VIKRLLSEGSPPTALLASDSLVGLRIFKSLQSLGLSIPKDVSMISFLDADWTSVTVPPITIVDQRVYEMGKLAGERLIARIERAPLAVERLRVSTSLVVRGSVTTIDR